MFLQQEFNLANCLEILNEIWKNDRWFDFKAFEKTACYCESVMKKIGLAEVEKLPLKADGKTVYGDWQMPQAWDASSATLTIEETGKVIADYLQTPTSLVMYSAPTARGGVRANVVDTDVVYATEDGTTVTADDNPDAWVKQAKAQVAELNNDVMDIILLTNKSAGTVVSLARELGAVGIISDFIPLYKDVRDNPFDLQGHSRWDNNFCVPKNETGLFAFDLSPENGKLLREMLENGKVVLHATVDTTFRDGVNYVVSGAILGETDEEVISYGHLYEPGALDNASGCAVLLSLAECMARGINEGKLPKPKRTLRFVVGWECVGSTAWLITHKQRQRKTVAGIVADMVGTEAIDNTFLRIWHNPMANYGFVDALIKQLIPVHKKNVGVDYPVIHREFGIATDNIMCDPFWGIPTISFITEPALSYHSSLDTPGRIDRDILRRCAVLIGTFMWECAQMNDDKKRLLADIAMDDLKELNPALHRELQNPTPPTGKKVPQRVTAGCLNLANRPDLADAKWQMSWNTKLHLPLFWTDGERDIEQITKLAAADTGRDDLDEYRKEIIEMFDFLAKNGYLEYK